MLTQDDINAQIQALPDAYIFWTGKEVRQLPKLLDQNERIVGLTSGMINGKTWLAVCTTRRLLFINCNWFIGFEQVQMPLDRIQSIDHQFTLFFGALSVFDGVNVFYLRMIRKSSILPFVKSVEEAMFNYRRGQSGVAAAAPQATDVASQLTKLAELKEKGYLTQAEFEAQKKKLLG